MVGRYRFSSAAFQKAIVVLSKALQEKEGILLLDEVGPLELNRTAFYEITKEIVSDKKPGLKKIIVVRDTLLEEVKTFFRFEHYQVIER
jgi:nucleoside-triphosphatase THEP1